MVGDLQEAGLAAVVFKGGQITMRKRLKIFYAGKSDFQVYEKQTSLLSKIKNTW